MLNYTDTIENPHKYLTQFKKRSKTPILGFLDPGIPVELIHSFGLHPTRLFPWVENSGSADIFIPNYVCEYARNLFSQGLDGVLDYIDGLIISINQCDTIRILADIWDQKLTHHIFSFYLPLKRDQTSLLYTLNELKALVARMEKYTKKAFSIESFTTSVDLYQRSRRILSELKQRRLKDPHILPFSDYNDLIILSDLIPRERYNKELEGLFQKYRHQKEDQPNRVTNRLLLMGGMAEDPKLFRWLEEAGAVIVWSELSFGSRYNQFEFNVDEQPLLSYAKALHYRIPDSITQDRSTRVTRIHNIIQENNINGVIYLQQKFCDPYGFEYALIKPLLEKIGLPHTFVEISSQTHTKGQIITHIQAFIEMLEDSPTT